MTNPDQKTAVGEGAVRIELLPPSFTMRVGNRRLTMRWRARKAVPTLLSSLLRRSWRAMFGNSLRISMTAAAICAAWNVPALAAAPPVNTLPTGGTVTYGNATLTQNGNTLNINQTSGQAIANFTTFSIGANATVDISQPSAAAAFLARVTGSDPSLIYGLLKSNGTVALINQNGIMVGPGGVVDVARFIASTLKISDSDFLAGRLSFNAGATAGDVDNQGTIKTATGGSVYLIGANVSNSGIIHSPNGEILLAAGQTVQLVDTATPGVSVNVTGTTGSVTNLGSITAEAGRIGIAAGLINNSGNINASSVVSDGGRIFLRASQNLTTTASSQISADGAGNGGSVVLYSDGAANLDGGISAVGAPGKGGYVETSGKQSLDVVKAPDVGTGGEWFIDPYDLTVVASGTSTVTNSGNVITSVGSSATIEAGTIATQLNLGNSVTLATGAGGSANGGNITVNAAINKTSGSAAALTLNADNNIIINADITSTSNKLGLNLNTNINGATTGTHSTQVNGATIGLNGGILNVSEGVAGNGNGNLSLNSGSFLNLSSNLVDSYSMPLGGSVKTGNLTINTGASAASTFGANVLVNGALLNNGVLNMQNSQLATGSMTNGASMTLANVSGSLGAVVNTGTLSLTNIFAGISASSVNNSGTLTATGSSTLNTGTFINGNGGSVTVNASTLNATTSFNNLGTLGVTNGSTLNIGALTNNGGATVSVSTLNVNTLTNAVGRTLTLTDSSLSATDTITNSGQLTVTNGTINTVNGFTNAVNAVLNLNYLSNVHTGSFNNAGTVTANGSAGYVTFENGFTNSGQMNFSNQIMSNGTVSNTGTIGVTDSYFRVNDSVSNSGSFNITNSRIEAYNGFNNNAQGTLNVNYNTTFLTGAVTNLGTMSLDSTANKPNGYTGLTAIGVNNGVTNFGNMSVLGQVTNDGVVTNGNSDHLTGNISMGSGASFSGGDWQNTGNLSLASGAVINGGDLSNNGRVVLNGASLAFNTVSNNNGAMLSGTGSIAASGQFTNNGVLSPGGIGTVGTLGITGNFTQGVTGVLNIDVASDTSYDVLTINAPTTVGLGGTLQTKLLGTYVPSLNTRFTPITFSDANAGSTYFSHVLGDVVNTGSALQMIKVDYKGALALAMSGSEDLTFSGGEGGSWNALTSWSTGNLPTAIDNVFINNGVVSHNVGGSTDIVNNLTIGSSAQLNVTAGGLQTTNLTAPTANIVVGTPEGPGGSLTVTGTAQIGSLSVLYDGYSLNGTSSSMINLNGAFSQNYNGIINSSGNVSLTQTDGNLTVGNITAANLTLASTTGAITQTDSLHVTKQLSTSSVAGTTLDNANNKIAAYLGANSGSGDIVLVNNLATADTSVVRLLGITNANGNVAVDNTGAMATVGPIVVSAGTLSLSTHSPLTIGTGGVNASGNILLSAGNSGSPLDNLVINGVVASSGGNINLFAGNSVAVNANITTSSPGQAIFNVVNGVIGYAPGVSITDVNGTVIPVAAVVAQVVTPVVTQTITPASNTVISSTSKLDATTVNVVPPTVPTASTTPVTTQTMTTGGEPGTFGGSDTTESTPTTSTGTSKSSTTKVTKMYCN